MIWLGRSGAHYASAENRDICELALKINAERGGGQNIVATLKEAEKRLADERAQDH